MSVRLLENGCELGPESTVRAKNDEVARRIAELTSNNPRAYFIPLEAVDSATASEHSITGDDDLYGGIVDVPEHADKAILHIIDSDRSDTPPPDWYVPGFSERILEAGAVLPGYTAFDPLALEDGFYELASRGYQVRIKDPSERCARGQTCVSSPEELQAITPLYAGKIGLTGVVLEADLAEAETVAVGYVRIGGQDYSWYGTTWDADHYGETKFGGNEITVVKGGLERLARFSDTPETHLAVTQTADVMGAYGAIDATIARATFDVIQGRAHNGEFLSGVTDPSIRPSASSPAEIRAIELFERDFPDANAITTRVIYDYGHFLREDHFTDRQLFTRSKKTSIFVDLVSVV